MNALLVPLTASTLGWPVAMLTGTAFAVLSAILWMFIRADRTISDGAPECASCSTFMVALCSCHYG